MRPKEPPRVMGPYEEREKWRIVVVENGKRKSVFLDTEAEALRAKSELERKVLRPVSKKLCDVINLWEQELLRSCTTKALSVTHRAFWARTLLKSMLEKEISVRDAAPGCYDVRGDAVQRVEEYRKAAGSRNTTLCAMDCA